MRWSHRLYMEVSCQEPASEGALSRQLIGRLAALLYGLGALAVLASLVLPAPPTMNRLGVGAVSSVALLVGLVLWFLPWQRWRRSTSLWFVPVAFTLLALLNHFDGGQADRYSMFFLFAFCWIGIGHRPGTSLRFVPVLALAVLLPLHSDGLLSPLAASTLVYTVVTCVLTSEMLAWVTRQLQLTQAHLQAREQYFRALSEHAADLVSVLDVHGIVRYASPSHTHVLGHTPAFLCGRSIFALVEPQDLPRLQAVLATTLATAEAVEWTECRLQHADGSWRTLELTGANRLADPAVRGIIVNARDISARKEAEASLRHQALSDALTGLPNRVLLYTRLQQALRGTPDAHAPCALLLLDLDRFKEVNDTSGHQHGDVLLQEVAQRLRQVLRGTDTLARLGGDEFALLLPGADQAGAVVVAGKIRAALEAALLVEGQALAVGASIGIALCPAHGTDPQTLMRHADVALYVAKRAGGGYAVYDAAQDQHSPRRLLLLHELRQALEADQLRLYYQPLVDLTPGRLTRVEALLRWQHPQHGFVPPDQFIPLAEHTDLIAPLTRWVLEEALRQCQAWQRAGLHLGMAVNLSTRTLHDPQLSDTIAWLLRRYAVAPADLTLEITESALMADPTGARVVLARLADLGVHIAIDDFGTGYSSLGYLKQLPVDEMKIDKCFVQGMGATSLKDTAIVRSIIELGHNLGLTVVAEGVETQAVWERLRAAGCDTAQGYHLSRPLPATDLERWIRASPWMWRTSQRGTAG